MTAALSLSGISVRFNGSRILDSVDLEIARGEWLGIIGPNGAGKTTLLRAITGAVEFEGSVTIEGNRSSTLKRRDLARSVALVPQHPVLPPGMRVVDYVLLGRTPHVHAVTGPSHHDLDVVATTLEALTLSAFTDRDVTTLSGGELTAISMVCGETPSISGNSRRFSNSSIDSAEIGCSPLSRLCTI